MLNVRLCAYTGIPTYSVHCLAACLSVFLSCVMFAYLLAEGSPCLFAPLLGMEFELAVTIEHGHSEMAL